VWSLLRAKKGALALVSLVVLLASVMGLVPPLIVKEILDDAIPSRNGTALLILAMTLLASGLFAKSLDLAQTWLEVKLGSELHFELSHRLFSSMHSQPMTFHDGVSLGEKISRLTYTTSIEGLLSGVYLPLISFTVMLVGSVILIISLDWRLAVLGLALLLPMVALSATISGPIQGLTNTFLRQQENVWRFATERIGRNGIIHIAVLNRGSQESQTYRELNRPLIPLNVRRSVLGVLPGTAISVASISITVLAFGVGGLYVLQGTLTIGSVVAFTLIASRLLEPAIGLVRLPATLSECVTELENVFEFLKDEEENVAPGRLTDTQYQFRGRIEFQQVTFQYNPEQPLLNNLSFIIEPNKLTAIVGANGEGKTTIAHLLIRLYEIQQGSIKIDGVDIRDLTLSQLRSAIGFLPFDPLFFRLSIADNLRLGDPKASQERLEETCRVVRMHEIILDTPQGYDTLIGDGGYELSSGQKQRLALARLLLRDPAVIVLDEVTAALDPDSEEALRVAFMTLAKSKTIIAIAHRLSMMQAADRVLVLHRGNIVEAGTHQALAEAGGIYHQLITGQLSDGARPGPRGPPGTLGNP
jgi:ATP-binding cassette subfamily B protein